MTTCPRCGSGLAATQEYCLDCGLHLPGTGRLGPAPLERRRLALPLIAAAVIAAAGAGAAIAVTWDDGAPGRILIATGASTTPSAPKKARPKLAAWPVGRDGWTIVLLSIPKGEGRAAAVERAEKAKERGLPRVGVVDSSRVAGLHPGYWAVFSGIYDTKPEATSELLQARNFTKTAATRKLSG